MTLFKVILLVGSVFMVHSLQKSSDKIDEYIDDEKYANSREKNLLRDVFKQGFLIGKSLKDKNMEDELDRVDFQLEDFGSVGHTDYNPQNDTASNEQRKNIVRGFQNAEDDKPNDINLLEEEIDKKMAPLRTNQQKHGPNGERDVNMFYDDKKEEKHAKKGDGTGAEKKHDSFIKPFQTDHDDQDVTDDDDKQTFEDDDDNQSMEDEDFIKGFKSGQFSIHKDDEMSDKDAKGTAVMESDTAEDSQSLANWMKDVPNHLKLCQIAIPGTHDTGAYRTPGDVGETQDWSPNQQLYNGIRFFDVRLSNNHRSDDFEIRHGILRLGSFKGLIMNYVRNFLARYPSETIFISIKNEGGPLDIGRLERLFIRKSYYKFYQHSIHSGTQLRNIRGKVVLFRRYSGGHNIGLKWNSDMSIQDDYNLGVECKKFWWSRMCSPLVGLDYPKKARTVIHFLKNAVRGYGHRFYINFASAQYKGMYIGNSAKYSNRALRDYFRSHGSTKVGSIIPMDYPNREHGLIQLIVNNNRNR